jgi:NADH:ubiquinone oxidoreductase subunit C
MNAISKSVLSDCTPAEGFFDNDNYFLINEVFSGGVLAELNLDQQNIYFCHRYNSESFFFYLKYGSDFSTRLLNDVIIIDNASDKFRFTVSYIFESFTALTFLRVVLKTTELLPIISLQSVFPTICWLEREAWDMFGVWFLKNDDMRRLLTDYGFSWHPLRKDFPVTGFRELYFEEASKQLEYNKIELSQKLRLVNIDLNSWDEKEV